MSNEIIAIARILRDWRDKPIPMKKCLYPIQIQLGDCPEQCPYNHPDIGCRHIKTATMIYNQIVKDKCISPTIYEIHPNNTDDCTAYADKLRTETARELLETLAYIISCGTDIDGIKNWVERNAKDYGVEIKEQNDEQRRNENG